MIVLGFVLGFLVGVLLSSLAGMILIYSLGYEEAKVNKRRINYEKSNQK